MDSGRRRRQKDGENCAVSVRAEQVGPLFTENYEIYELKDDRIWAYGMHDRMHVLVGRHEGKSTWETQA